MKGGYGARRRTFFRSAPKKDPPGGAGAGLTAAELTWALVYSIVGEQMPAIWLLPLLAGLAVLTVVTQLRPKHASAAVGFSN